MKIAITGHTSGIGQAFAKHFQSHEVIGFSRSNGYDIADPDVRNRIISEITDVDVFINNAYHDDSQLKLLTSVYDLWKGKNKTIVNISSRYTTGPEQYCKDKELQDLFCKSKERTLPYIINLKPGLVDTPRVMHIPGERLSVNDVVAVLDVVLNSNYKIHTVTFGL
jgi:nucleoside-diphosphate-sugar epimerase